MVPECLEMVAVSGFESLRKVDENSGKDAAAIRDKCTPAEGPCERLPCGNPESVADTLGVCV
jgi:hypothetical protein